jgi:sialic acid synthase SpsE/dTDP-4-dehydrorhamnose reductase
MAILLFGATGMLGRAIATEAARRDLPVVGASRHGPDRVIDLAATHLVRALIESVRPNLVINAAAITSLDACERDPCLANAVNARAVEIMSEYCRAADIALVHVSTDHFFTGDRDRPHCEGAPVTLVNAYARAKFAAEGFAALSPRALVVRTNVTGLRGSSAPTFAEWALDALERRAPLRLFDDFFASTIDAPSLARALFDLVGGRAAEPRRPRRREQARLRSWPRRRARRDARLGRAGQRHEPAHTARRKPRPRRAARRAAPRLRASRDLAGVPQPRHAMERKAMRYSTRLVIGAREIALDAPTYFVADIASNHDGDLERAKSLIWRAKDAGADAVKFQHFQAEKIVSDVGFRRLGGQIAHQSKWRKSVFDVYRQYSLDRNWDPVLVETARAAGIDWMTTPYDREATDAVADVVPAFKIGSGDITWLESIEHVASKGKPVLLATGASDLAAVVAAVEAVLRRNSQLCLMQCNTNYTGSLENLRYVNLRVLQSYAVHWPGLPLGLSDHTPGHATVLGAIAFGARVVEKHFTDDATRSGPDHGFSMTPAAWREMVERARELEAALGDGIKRIEANEREAAVVQRRCLRLVHDLAAGALVGREDLVALRPAPQGSLAPPDIGLVVGRRLRHAKEAGAELRLDDLAPASEAAA